MKRTIWAKLSALTSELQDFIASRLEQTDPPFNQLTSKDVFLLHELCQSKDGLSSKILAGKLAISPSNCSHSIDKLTNCGLIKRGVDPLDGRSAVICLTDLGQRHKSFIVGVVQLAEKRFEGLV